MNDKHDVSQTLDEWNEQPGPVADAMPTLDEAKKKEWTFDAAPGREADDVVAHLRKFGLKARVVNNVRGAAALGVRNVSVAVEATGKAATVDGLLSVLDNAFEMTDDQRNSIRRSNKRGPLREAKNSNPWSLLDEAAGFKFVIPKGVVITSMKSLKEAAMWNVLNYHLAFMGKGRKVSQSYINSTANGPSAKCGYLVEVGKTPRNEVITANMFILLEAERTTDDFSFEITAHAKFDLDTKVSQSGSRGGSAQDYSQKSHESQGIVSGDFTKSARVIEKDVNDLLVRIEADIAKAFRR